MPDLSLVVVSQDSALIKAMRAIAGSQKDTNLSVSPSLDHVLDLHRRQDLDLIVVHVTPQHEPKQVLDFLHSVNGSKGTCPILLLSDEYHQEQAVAFLRAGATEYFGPIQEQSRLAELVDVLTMFARSEKTQAQVERAFPFDLRNVTLAPDLLDLMEQLRRVIPQQTNLLLAGATGTGKTRLARLIHELSPRRHEPFVIIDCGSLTGTLIESEMFGHVRGAFTGADRDKEGKLTAAGKGTLLLDEINSLPLHLQSKLLRAVDDRRYEPVGSTKTLPLCARVIAAANVQLEDEVAAGTFRADLFYRLNVVSFFLSPLRERRSSIIPLANKFLAIAAEENNRDLRRIGDAALEALLEYDWPGNIRELRNAIERAVALAPGQVIELEDLPHNIRQPNGPSGARGSAFLNGHAEFGSLAKTKEEAEIVRIRAALNKHGNNRLRAAAELGISRMGLYKKLHKYGLMSAV
jgi:DNA-binding NtrC family response regulator